MVVKSSFVAAVLMCIHVCVAIHWQTSNDAVWSLNCDFRSHDIGSARTPGHLCSSTCSRTSGCTHFAWTDYNGGTCWMKRKAGIRQSEAISNSSPGSVCGILRSVLSSKPPSDSQGGSGHRVSFKSSCSQDIFVGILGNPGKVHADDGGFRLNRGQTRSIVLPAEWAGRFWGRTGCDQNGQGCETGKCGGDGENCKGTGGEPPVTLAEITFDASCCDGIDFYDISLVDGYNLQMRMKPVVGTYRFRSNDQYDCKEAGCTSSLNRICPNELKKIGRNGNVVGCKSACLAFNSDRYCCRGSHGTPQTCPPFSYSEIFKKACPRAYSYAYDDKASTFSCKGNSRGASSYEIQFC